jgi:hypothetical protein
MKFGAFDIEGILGIWWYEESFPTFYQNTTHIQEHLISPSCISLDLFIQLPSGPCEYLKKVPFYH